MKPERCPKCGETRIRRSSAFLRHCWRVLLNKSHRFCTSCGHKWDAKGFIHDHSPRLDTSAIAIIIACSIAILLTVVFLAVRGDPVGWAKTKIRDHYDDKYGEAADQKLWDHFGRWYGAKRSAQEDYHQH